MQGFKPRKTRLQGQDSRLMPFTDFRGGQNSDMPGTRIGMSDMALLRNCVAYAGGIEGGAGARLASPERLPGTGTRHYLAQHPITGRWIFHRGRKIWISRGRKAQEWEESTPIGPDVAQTATITFIDGQVTITGAVSAVLSDMLLTGVVGGQELVIAIADSAGPSLTVIVSNTNGDELARGTMLVSAQPEYLTLTATGGSGVSGSVLVEGYSTPLAVGAGVVNTYSIELAVSGLTEENSNDYTLYSRLVLLSGNITINLYKDEAATELVATGTYLINRGRLSLYGSDTTITGLATWEDISTRDGDYGPQTLVFAGPDAIPDATSSIYAQTADGFLVFVQGATPRNVFVDQRIGKYMYLSERSGYGISAFQGSRDGSGPQREYRYLYTYVRLVDPVTGLPSETPGTSNRTTSQLLFEGPSNKPNYEETDYTSFNGEGEVEPDFPNSLVFDSADNSGPISLNAASYITHKGVYRALQTAPNTYVWVGDRPIAEETWEDTTTEAVLLNRFGGGSELGENFALRSRFYTEMSKGIGCLRPDFMATAVPLSDRVDYCDTKTYPRFIGYHYPARQFFPTQDPVTQISATKSELVVHCPKSTYVANPAIQIDVGISGIVAIPVIQYFERVSQSIGIKYGQRTFPVDENSFVTLCSDGTVRVFSAGQWGEPLDGLKVSKLTQLAVPGATLAFVDGVVLMWYATSVAATTQENCLRLGTGGKDGFGWSQIERDKWPSAVLGGGLVQIYEREDATTSLIVVDADTDTLFAVEDMPPLRQYRDDVPGRAPFVAGTDLLANISCTGWDYTILYGTMVEDEPGLWRVRAYEEEAHVNLIMQSGLLSDPQLAVDMFGTLSATIDVLALAAIEFEIRDGVNVASQSEIEGEIAFRELTATQENFRCMHQQSHLFMRNPYGLPIPVVTAKWYGDGALIDEAEVPVDGDIQSYRRIEGRYIQVRYVMASSGWLLTGADTMFQTHDIQSQKGAANAGDGLLQRALALGMISWVNGATGLLNRASAIGASYEGATPARIPGPYDAPNAQMFATPVTIPFLLDVTQFTVSFWIRNPIIGAVAVDSSPFVAFVNEDPVIYTTFPDANTADIGPFQYPLDPPVGDEWQHFCITRDEGYFSFYQNGVLVRRDLQTPGSLWSLTTARLGSPAGQQPLFDPRMYEKCLSAAEVAYYYDNLGQIP